jgi:solute:Na+ symporter, SSS family
VSVVTISTFVLATATVAVLTAVLVKRLAVSKDATEEFFSGGRALGWVVVGGSLLLTNLSTEQLVGLNGAVFLDGNLVGVCWEVLAAIAMVCTAMIFLPRYLASGFTTTPAFLEKRFDKTTRSMVSGLFLFGYVTVLLPVVLYTGSLALKGMFNLDLPLWMIATGIGLLGSGYAIVGGLKAVAVSDTLNGAGLLIGGLCIPYLAISELGDGSVLAGISLMAETRPESFAVIGDDTKSVPWHTLLTGMMLIQVFYWSTNQVIVQRAMGAKNLAEGQKGVLFASGMKLIGPLILCLPALAALHMKAELGLHEAKIGDLVYPAVVRHVLPGWSLGLFCAVLVGAILSSFNSALNSASTLFSLQFYKGYIRPEADAVAVVRSGRLFGSVIAVGAMAIAPMLGELESIFEYLQKINGLYSVPIIAIFLLGIANKTAPPLAAKVGMVVGIACYAIFIFGVGEERLHFLHSYGISFLVAMGVMLAIARLQPKSEEEIAVSDERVPAPVDMTPWRLARPASISIIAAVVAIYAGLTALAL